MEQGTISMPKGGWTIPGQKRVIVPGREQVLMANKGYFQRESRFSEVDITRILVCLNDRMAICKKKIGKIKNNQEMQAKTKQEKCELKLVKPKCEL